MSKYFIGIDVGGTNVRIGLVDESLNIIHEEKHQSKKIGKNLGPFIKEFALKHKENHEILAISIGFPGLVDQATRSVLHIPNQRDFEGDYLLKIEEELGIPIIVGNDVNLLMLYDASFFGIDPNKSVLGFYLGTGFGNAIRIKNQLYQGEFGAAGEIGHVPVYLNGYKKDETQDDLESIVSGFNLIKIHEKHFKDTPFEEIFKKHFDSEPIQTYLHILAFYIATEMTILDISTIILGGGVIMSEQFPKAYLERLIKKNLFAKLTQENFKTYYAHPAVNSGILGAVLYAKSHLSI